MHVTLSAAGYCQTPTPLGSIQSSHATVGLLSRQSTWPLPVYRPSATWPAIQCGVICRNAAMPVSLPTYAAALSTQLATLNPARPATSYSASSRQCHVRATARYAGTCLRRDYHDIINNKTLHAQALNYSDSTRNGELLYITSGSDFAQGAFRTGTIAVH